MSAELDRTITEFDAAKIAYQKEELTLAQFNLCSYNAETARINREGLGIVRGRVEEIWNYSTEKGFTPWLIDETPFESVYGTAAKKNQHKAAIAAVLTLTLILAGNMTYERQSGMTFLLKATPRGRVTLLSRKILLSALSTVVVWIIVYGMELHSLVSDFSIETWSVPVQNLSMMTQFPINCSISMWLVLLYGYRLWALFCGALLVLLISGLMKRIEVSYILSCGIMLIPSLLYAYVNIDVLRPVSYIVGVEAMPLLLSENGGVLQFVIWIAALTAIAVFSIVRLFVSSNNYKKSE